MFIIYLKGYRREKGVNDDISSLIMFAQIHGHLQIDKKWLPNTNKLTTLVEEDEDHVLLDRPSQLPANPSGMDSNATCFLASAKVTLSPSHLENTGTIIESFIPTTALSTCRGRSLSVHYYLSIYTQSSVGTSVVHFPLHVYGNGYGHTPYKRMYVGIVAYPLTILPIESFYESDPSPKLCTQSSFHTHTQSHAHTHTHTIYKVRDTQHICNVHIHNNHLCMGQKFLLHLDFTHNEQRCEAVRMSLVMQEVYDMIHVIQVCLYGICA
ncbi:hypothetical protein EON63_15770 [archaeon]|nr:MAG: hypothetical protein EON63_15770 [archaeon]